MDTRDIVLRYLHGVRAREGWENLLADELQFTNFMAPVQRFAGKQASLDRLRRFYGMVNVIEVDQVIVDGRQACALTRYELRSPDGSQFESHIAEIFEVENGAITSLGIYFDSAPYPPPGTRGPNPS